MPTLKGHMFTPRPQEAELGLFDALGLGFKALWKRLRKRAPANAPVTSPGKTGTAEPGAVDTIAPDSPAASPKTPSIDREAA